MLNENSGNRCGVLYIDDEEKALKYFKMAFSQKFEVFTAMSGKEGIETLRREAGRIGVVISDQRMPEMLGAEILGIARQEYPEIVRILTTAYSDLDSAIQAVNRGHIYQYVVKPWDLTELGMVLQRAADYFHVLSERNELMALKMSTLQRIVCSDRVKWLLLASRSWSDGEQANLRSGLSALIAAMPPEIYLSVSRGGKGAQGDFDASALIQSEYHAGSRILEMLAGGGGAGATSESCDHLDAVVGAKLQAMDAGLPASLEAFLGAMKSEQGPVVERMNVCVNEDGGAMELQIEFAVNSEKGDLQGVFRSLFAVLSSCDAFGASVNLLKMAAAFGVAGFGRIRLIVTSGESGGVEAQLPLGECNSVSADDVLQYLADRFSSWDISSL